MSKLVAGRPKDFDYVKVLLQERLVPASVLLERIRATSQLAPSRQAALAQTVQRLAL